MNPIFFRREITNQLNTLAPEDISILKSIQKPENVVLHIFAAETRCERSLRHGETIDTRLIAQLFLCQETFRAEYLNTNLRYYDERHKICFSQLIFTNFEMTFGNLDT